MIPFSRPFNALRYRRKTKEDPEDRQESIFFYHVDNNTEEWQAKKQELWDYVSPDSYPEDLVDHSSMGSSFSSEYAAPSFTRYWDSSDSWDFSGSTEDSADSAPFCENQSNVWADTPKGVDAWDKRRVAIWLATSTELGVEERRSLKEVNGKSLLAFKVEDLVNVVGLHEEPAKQVVEAIAEAHEKLISKYTRPCRTFIM